ncbi:hypothetical protein A2774_00390 [Candidatus Roizmanbacteria bacterium RIFCSPHIGHO2_01_FULL_39_12c]|uniref:Large ribosomal subunit protein bL25 n=1 Tax=Candidatus Roizmanbacteria bacterium RIFCSPHIGHO2_01_FULL_39_12c TaxID=1802031 RepID=A0A1F7GDB0_9BACT|nr:MAG: hypothetical protein A2774_00390 [Candidatus Roizmanbacteria bacterium RIFCSPHIGHO2_01_FULL_39_12c]
MSKNKQDSRSKLTLKVETRKIFGKKLKKSRREGHIPANIYGHNFKSQSVSVEFKEFVKVYKIAKETGVIYLKLDKDELPVLIKNVQTHPVNDQILHIDFRKIDLSKKIQTAVPVKAIGESEAVETKGGVLLTQVETLQIEALPADIPSRIEIDISIIKEVGGEIKVADLPKSEKYTLLDLPEKIIVSVVEHKEEEALPQTAPAEAPEITTAKPEDEEVVEAKKTPEETEKKPEQAKK